MRLTLREVLSHNGNALLVPPEDIEEWARALRELERNRALRERLANQAFEDVAKKFTWEKRAVAVLAGVIA